MAEKQSIARRPLNPVDPRPASDSDSEFEGHTEVYTPRTSIVGGEALPDAPPSYEESEAQVQSRNAPRPIPPGIANHSDITVYRTEIPPDPLINVPVQAASDQKRPVSPQSTGPRASGLLNEALRFTEIPPPTAERPDLRVPVSIPSLARREGPVKFARFYAPVLHSHSIASSDFIDFVDGLNALSTASNFTLATFQSRNALSPYEVSRDDDNLQREDLVSAYIVLSNSYFFNPRGLQIQITDLAQLADLLGIGNATIRKAVLQEVLRMSRTGIDVPTAANGAALQAAEALVPYIETLTSAVAEPKKHQEALEAVASRFASMHLSDEAPAYEEGVTRQETSSQGSGSGPPRTKSWNEVGNDIGKFWGDWGEKQGKWWGKWGEDQGKMWGDFGKKWGHGPPAWAVGPSGCGDDRWRGGSPHGRGGEGFGRTRGRGFGGGPFGQPGPGGFTSGPFGHPGPTGFGRHGRHGRGGLQPAWSMPPQPTVPHVTVPRHPSVPMMPHVLNPMATSYASTPHPLAPTYTHPLAPAIPGLPFLPTYTQGPHQPPATSPPNPHSHHDAENDEQDFADVADTLSLSSISSNSSSTSSKTFVHEDLDIHAEHEAIFARKVAHIESLAASARARNTPAPLIEAERTRALLIVSKEKTKHELASAHAVQKGQLKRDIHAWKRGVKGEIGGLMDMGKNERKEWKKGKKSEWKGLKGRMKEEGKGYRKEKKEVRRELREAKREAKREGKKRVGGGRRGWEESGRRGMGSGDVNGDAEGSLESLNEEVEGMAGKMLWVVITKFEGGEGEEGDE